MAKKLIKVMDTSFRDGFQSCIGARIFTKDYLPALKAAVEAGIEHFETGGGALFQSLVYYANENPFENMDLVRNTVGPNVKLQTLSRGVNLVCLKSQSSDIIDLHAKMFKKHGIDIIRNFDALNDVDNLIYSGECIKNANLKHEVTVTMMELPPGCEGAHTTEFYIETLKRILDSGLPFDSIAFKDASGTCDPKKVYETFKGARDLVGCDISLRFHSHETAGVSVLAYKAALEGGANAIDLAMFPLSGGSCQPDHLTMWHALKGSEYELGYDIDKMMRAQKVLQDCLEEYFMPPEATQVNPSIIFSPLPGGALTANTQMMRDNGVMDKFPEVVRAMREVVEKGGFGTSVTPVSQFYFQQAYNNVIFGPWKKIADGYGKMVLGYFGKTPCEADEQVVKLASEQLQLEPTKRSPREINDENPQLGIKAATKMLEDENLPVTDENIFIAAACESKGINFLKGQGQVMVRKNVKIVDSKKSDNFIVNLDGNNYSIKFENDKKAIINGKSFEFTIKESDVLDSDSSCAKGDGIFELKAGLPGNVLKILVKESDIVSEGDVLLILEAMKMETEIKACKSGRVERIYVEVGNQVQTGQVLLTIA